MESLPNYREGPWCAPSSQLWGREVYDENGHRVGTIDSIVRTHRGPARAIVRTRGRRPRRFVFINLDEAVFDGDAVIVFSTSLERPDNDTGVVAARPRLAWPLGLTHRRLRPW